MFESIVQCIGDRFQNDSNLIFKPTSCYRSTQQYCRPRSNVTSEYYTSDRLPPSCDFRFLFFCCSQWNRTFKMTHCLIRCVRICESVQQGFGKLLFDSCKLNTLRSRPINRTCLSLAFTNEKKLLKRDKLTPDYQLIYRLHRRKWWIFIACGAYILLIGSPLILVYPFVTESRRYYKPVDKEQLLENFMTNVFATDVRETIAYSVFVVLFNALIYWIIRRYVLRIYFNGEKYVAVYINGYWPMKTKNHYYERARRTRNLMFFLPDSNYRLGNRNARLFINSFRRPVDFENMLVTPYYPKEEDDAWIFYFSFLPFHYIWSSFCFNLFVVY